MAGRGLSQAFWIHNSIRLLLQSGTPFLSICLGEGKSSTGDTGGRAQGTEMPENSLSTYGGLSCYSPPEGEALSHPLCLPLFLLLLYLSFPLFLILPFLLPTNTDHSSPCSTRHCSQTYSSWGWESHSLPTQKNLKPMKLCSIFYCYS